MQSSKCRISSKHAAYRPREGRKTGAASDFMMRSDARPLKSDKCEFGEQFAVGTTAKFESREGTSEGRQGWSRALGERRR